MRHILFSVKGDVSYEFLQSKEMSVVLVVEMRTLECERIVFGN